MKKFLFFLLLSSLTLSSSAQVPASHSSRRASNPNKVIGEAIKKTGTVSLSIGVPCLAGGIASLVYAYMLPNPTNGYTTSKALAAENNQLQYMSASEYISKLESYNGTVQAFNTAGYIMTSAGATMTIIGIPLYCYGKQLMTLNVNYTGNGAGVSIKF